MKDQDTAPGRGRTEPPRLMRLLQDFVQVSDRYVEATGGRNAMHRTDMNALSVMLRHEQAGLPLTPGELGRELNLSSPATTALVDRLERSGHVERLRADTDRRRVLIRSTEKARSDGRRMFGPLGRELGATMSTYTPEELGLLERFMDDAVAAVVRAAQHPET
jgi:DNA-binding MarR family transcriptional regulator